MALEILEMLLKVAELVLGTIISQGLQQSKLMMLIMTQLSEFDKSGNKKGNGSPRER